jgi:hypothetical protein
MDRGREGGGVGAYAAKMVALHVGAGRREISAGGDGQHLALAAAAVDGTKLVVIDRATELPESIGIPRCLQQTFDRKRNTTLSR